MTLLRASVVVVIFIVVHCAGQMMTIGNCSGEQIKEKNFQCQVNLFVELRTNPDGDCTAMYARMRNCSEEVVRSCFDKEDQTAAMLINILMASLTLASDAKVIYCEQGGLELSITAASADCSSELSASIISCTDEYHSMFANNPADPGLCRKYNETIGCALTAIDNNCNESDRESLKLSLNHRNPICEADKIMEGTPSPIIMTPATVDVTLDTEQPEQKTSDDVNNNDTEKDQTKVTETLKKYTDIKLGKQSYTVTSPKPLFLVNSGERTVPTNLVHLLLLCLCFSLF
ncbi:uncharacterized protein LOC144443558 [Glandiceps talaboti]